MASSNPSRPKMKVFQCPFQGQAKASVTRSLQDKDLVLLRGDPLSGKSTVLSLLFSSTGDPKGLWPIVIRSPHVHVCKSLKLSLAHALGLPNTVMSASPGALISVLHELSRNDLSVVLAIDDIDIFFLGTADEYKDTCDFIFYLSRALTRLKIVGAFSRLEKINSIARDLKIENHCVLELPCWQPTTEFFDFVNYVAGKFGIKKYQVSDEAFLKSLFDTTGGATGAIVTSIKILGMSGVINGGKVASSDHLRQLWRF